MVNEFKHVDKYLFKLKEEGKYRTCKWCNKRIAKKGDLFKDHFCNTKEARFYYNSFVKNAASWDGF